MNAGAMRARRAALQAIALSTLALAPALAQFAPPDSGVSIIISIAARRLWVLDANGDMLLSAPAAVGSGRTLRGPDRSWKFQTPQGVTAVTAKEENPVWVPPDWHYLEVAKQQRLSVQRVDASRAVLLRNGDNLVVRRATRGGVERSADER